MITVHFSCSGCDATAEGTRWLQRRFLSLDGSGFGFGRYEFTSAEDVAPEGWIAFDPYTGCCYCPDCWAEIENPSRPVAGATEGARRG